ncbi:transposase family protein [Yinghuangia sp. YIM S09857]|uniref:transposase family protein n=1 Tax=Yinghuangia sp. YIM S09857 TaxID=3436929 RepID=UPI003F5327B4
MQGACRRCCRTLPGWSWSLSSGSPIWWFVVRDNVHRPADAPSCGTASERVHDRCLRQPEDTPLAGTRVEIVVSVRRFKCGEPSCPAATFAEQVPGLTRPHVRYIPPMRTVLAQIAGMLSGRPGIRLADRFGAAGAGRRARRPGPPAPRRAGDPRPPPGRLRTPRPGTVVAWRQP